MSNIKVLITDMDQARRAERYGPVSKPRGEAKRDLALRHWRYAIYAMLIILISHAGAKAGATVSLSEYRARIGRAAIALDSLSSFDEDVSEKESAARISSTLRDVRRSIPQTLAVEWNGAPMQVNNAWLEDALKQYEEVTTPNALRDDATRTRRAAVLLSITERLHALAERLDEVLKAQQKSAGAGGKDEEKARLAAILRRSEYNREAQESALARLWARIRRWLRSLFPEREPAQEVETGRRGTLFTKLAEFLVIALALVAIAYALWKFVPRFLRNRGGRRREKREARVVLGERLAPDQTARDILSEAERLARSGDIRGAIRKGYIAVLCELGDRRILSLAQHKTNRDYLRALSDRRPLYGEMQVLTNSFENHWYGYAPCTESDWTAFRLHYQQALEKQG